MDTEDRRAIDGLFAKLDDVERQAGPRDAEAERFIAERVSRQPGAPYYMAQTIVMQEMALERAQAELEQLRSARSAPQPQGGGLLGRLFGGGQPAARAPAPAMARTPAASSASGAWSGQAGAQAAQPGYAQHGRGMGGGGFLAGAAQTAMGVAGGVLLGNAIGGMFAGDTPAAETAAAEPAAAEPQVEEAAYDDGGFDDFGGDEI